MIGFYFIFSLFYQFFLNRLPLPIAPPHPHPLILLLHKEKSNFGESSTFRKGSRIWKLLFCRFRKKSNNFYFSFSLLPCFSNPFFSFYAFLFFSLNTPPPPPLPRYCFRCYSNIMTFNSNENLFIFYTRVELSVKISGASYIKFFP